MAQWPHYWRERKEPKNRKQREAAKAFPKRSSALRAARLLYMPPLKVESSLCQESRSPRSFRVPAAGPLVAETSEVRRRRDPQIQEDSFDRSRIRRCQRWKP